MMKSDELKIENVKTVIFHYIAAPGRVEMKSADVLDFSEQSIKDALHSYREVLIDYCPMSYKRVKIDGEEFRSCPDNSDFQLVMPEERFNGLMSGEIVPEEFRFEMPGTSEIIRSLQKMLSSGVELKVLSKEQFDKFVEDNGGDLKNLEDHTGMKCISTSVGIDPSAPPEEIAKAIATAIQKDVIKNDAEGLASDQAVLVDAPKMLQ
jgi:hypothetical protein